MDNKHQTDLSPRLLREYETVYAMISIFCIRHHGTKNICNDCRQVLDYSMERLKKCPFGKDKPTCANCLVHCYQPIMRGRIREIMRFSGPRMIYRHPVLAIRHLLDGKRKGN